MLERAILCLLYLYCASMAVSEPIANFAVDVSLLLGLAHLYRTRDLRVDDRGIYILATAYLCMLVVSALGAYEPRLAIHPIWVSFYYTLIPFYLAGRYVDTEKKRWIALGLMLFSVSLTAVHTLWQSYLQFPRPQGFLYLLETGAHIDQIGILALVLLCCHSSRPTWFKNTTVVPLLFLFCAALLATLSRQPWLAAALATLMFMVLARVSWRKSLSVLLVAVVIVGIAVSVYPDLRQRVQSLTDRNNIGAWERFYMWKEAWAKFSDHPVAGIGPGNSPVVDYRYVLPQRIDRSPLIHPHNILFHLLAETGVIGASAFLILYGYILRHLYRGWKISGSPWVLGVFLATISVLLNGMSENFVFGVLPVKQSEWFLLGMVWNAACSKNYNGVAITNRS